MTSTELMAAVQAAKFEHQARPAAALAGLYDTFDEALHAGRFDDINYVLTNLCVDEFDIDILLALLIISKWAESALPSRSAFFNRVEQYLQGTYKDTKELLIGLKPAEPNYR